MNGISSRLLHFSVTTELEEEFEIMGALQDLIAYFFCSGLTYNIVYSLNICLLCYNGIPGFFDIEYWKHLST